MALQLSKNLNNGFTGNYWRVINCDIDHKNSSALIRIALFKDSSASSSGKDFLEVINYDFTDDFPFSLSELDEKNPQKIAYEKIKEFSEFDGAIDV